MQISLSHTHTLVGRLHSRNRWGYMADLNEGADSDSFRKVISEIGRRVWKGTLLKVLVCGEGMHSAQVSAEERRWREGEYTLSRSARYGGQEELTLKQKEQILYWILASTGSRCRVCECGVIRSVLATFKMRRATLLWTLLTLLMRYFGQPMRWELQ